MSGIVGAGAVSPSGVIGKFPSGHVIQTVEHQTGPTSQVFDTDVDTVITATINNVLPNSLCIVWGGGTFRTAGTGTYHGGEIYCYRAETNLGTGGNTSAMSFPYHNMATTETYLQSSFCVKDTTPAVGTNVYTLRASGYSSHSMNCVHDGLCYICVMEVAQ